MDTKVNPSLGGQTGDANEMTRVKTPFSLESGECKNIPIIAAKSIH
jgi:hypothetical protein